MVHADDIALVDDLLAGPWTSQARYEIGRTPGALTTGAAKRRLAILEPARNRRLSELAVPDTGLGNVNDKSPEHAQDTRSNADSRMSRHAA